MRIVTEPRKQEFTPFEVTFKVETEEEARLLYHVLNRADLNEVLREASNYGFGSYLSPIASKLGTDREVEEYEKLAEANGVRIRK